MKKTEREAKAEEITRTARAIIQAEEISRRKKTERLRKLRERISREERAGAKPAGEARH
jgi:hypothetical protein